MKSLKQFIIENVNIYRLTEVIATYLVQPSEIILQAPETFDESDIQIYMDDLWLNDLPSSDKLSKKIFGINGKSITDAHFEYDTFEHTNIEPKKYIEWDAKYDYSSSNNEDVKLEYFVIKNLKYIISFDMFDLQDVNDDNVQQKLEEIFKSAESNNYNKYPIEIIFNKDSLEYKK